MTSASESPPPPPDEPASEGREQTEREQMDGGPLEIERYVKDDGRSLLLYAHRERRDP